MSLQKSYLLGMDLGTTNIKGNLMDEDGNLISTASRPNSRITPSPGRVEQDPMEWWGNACEILKDMTEQAGEDVVANIKGISISSQCITLLPVDENGNPLYNAIIYQDSRAAKEIEEVCQMLGFERFVDIVGGLPSVGFLPGKLLWFKRNEPEIFAKTHSILQANGWLNYKLTGAFTIDIDTASRTQCMNFKKLEWSRDIGEALEIDLNKVLPKPVLCTEIIGHVTEEAAKETGLKAGIPVIGGCSDAMASMYATGMSKLGDAGESSGTTSLVFASANKRSATNAPVVTRPTGLDEMPFVYDGPIGSSGASIKWYLENFGVADEENAKKAGMSMYDFMNKQALEAEPGAGGLLFFPYLVAGERAPLWNSHARGMFIGLTIETKRQDIARSVFEGTAFALRHVMDVVKKSGGQANVIRITGGGAKSRTWNMIKASMLHMPVYVMDEKSGDVPVCDVLLVGHAVGVLPDLSKAIEKMIKVKEIIEPIPEWEAVYDELYPYYLDMYEHLDKDLEKMSNLKKRA